MCRPVRPPVGGRGAARAPAGDHGLSDVGVVSVRQPGCLAGGRGGAGGRDHPDPAEQRPVVADRAGQRRPTCRRVNRRYHQCVLDRDARAAVPERGLEQDGGAEHGLGHGKRQSGDQRIGDVPAGERMELQRRPLHADRHLHAVGALTAALALLAAAPAAAQSSVEVSPLRVELKAAPGAATTQAITVANTGSAPVRVRATISDWHLSRDGAPQFVEASDPKYSASGWMRVAPPEQVIDPGKDATVRFTLTVPADAAPAGYRSSVLFEFGPATQPAVRPREVQVRSRIATLVYANVGEPPAAVDPVDLASRIVKEQPIQIVSVLKNSGRRTVRTRGTLTLYDKNGTVISQTVVPDVPVLPESEREVAIPALDPGK